MCDDKQTKNRTVVTVKQLLQKRHCIKIIIKI